MTEIVLGIHSNVTSGDKTGGHAWISVTVHGITTCYGLWPDSHPMVPDNGPASDIRTNLESISGAASSRYYALTDAQYTALQRELGQNVTWAYTHNCSSWASEVVYRIVGEDVNADDWGLFGAESPRELGHSIQQLEARNPTSRFSPRPAGAGAGGSSSSSSFSSAAR